CRTLVRIAGPLVPRQRRDEWKAEWFAELHYRIHALDRAALLNAAARRNLVLRSLGAVPHALWLRRSEWRLDELIQDLAFAFRVGRKQPAFSLLVIATLALGIGATSAMFSIVNSVLIQPLPVPRSERLLYAFGASNAGNQGSISAPDFLDYRAQTKTIASFAA